MIPCIEGNIPCSLFNVKFLWFINVMYYYLTQNLLVETDIWIADHNYYLTQNLLVETDIWIADHTL